MKTDFYKETVFIPEKGELSINKTNNYNLIQLKVALSLGKNDVI